MGQRVNAFYESTWNTLPCVNQARYAQLQIASISQPAANVCKGQVAAAADAGHGSQVFATAATQRMCCSPPGGPGA